METSDEDEPSSWEEVEDIEGEQSVPSMCDLGMKPSSNWVGIEGGLVLCLGGPEYAVGVATVDCLLASLDRFAGALVSSGAVLFHDCLSWYGMKSSQCREQFGEGDLGGEYNVGGGYLGLLKSSWYPCSWY